MKTISEFKYEYRFLSNFFPCQVEIDGATYPSVEHAYMSHKNDDPQWKLDCQNPRFRPADIKQMGRKIKLRQGWDEIRIDVMRTCLEAKFSIPSFREKLLATGDAHLEEGNWWGDTFWGVSSTSGKGLNYLGRLLMEIRDNIKTQS